MTIDTSVPQFAFPDVLTLAEIDPVELRPWRWLEYNSILPAVKLERLAERPLTGSEVLLIVAIAELSRRGIGPSPQAARIADNIVGECRTWNNQENLHAWGDPDRLSGRDVDRYVRIYFDESGRLTSDAVSPMPDEPGEAKGWTDIDCYALAKDVFEALEALPRIHLR
jgi:hypothetical protein